MKISKDSNKSNNDDYGKSFSFRIDLKYIFNNQYENQMYFIKKHSIYFKINQKEIRLLNQCYIYIYNIFSTFNIYCITQLSF